MTDAGHAEHTWEIASASARCDGCGRPLDEGDHGPCRERRAATDPPRYCTRCGRKLAVQILPTGWTARCVHCDPPAATPA